MKTSHLKLGLDAAMVVLVIAGVAIWISDAPIPTATASVPSDKPVSPTVERVSTGDNASAAATIVAGNIFSATRAAPAVRYNPPADGVAEDIGDVAYVPPAPVNLPRVYGTMSGPGGAMALIQHDSAGASSRLFREGDRVGPFRIEKILTNSVVLRGPSGRAEIPVEQREERNQ